MAYTEIVATLTIVTGSDNPLLRRKTEPVPQITKEVKKLLKNMRETTITADGGGLAAPQIGRTERLCLTLVNGKLIPLINPQITWKNPQTEIAQEGCLSLPGIWLNVPRYTEIIVEYLDEKGAEQKRKLVGWDARVVQHEVDHLDGILITDYRQEFHSPERHKQVA